MYADPPSKSSIVRCPYNTDYQEGPIVVHPGGKFFGYRKMRRILRLVIYFTAIIRDKELFVTPAEQIICRYRDKNAPYPLKTRV